MTLLEERLAFSKKLLSKNNDLREYIEPLANREISEWFADVVDRSHIFGITKSYETMMSFITGEELMQQLHGVWFEMMKKEIKEYAQK